MVQLTVIQQVADHFFAACADSVVQERAASLIPVHEVTPSSVQLLELRAGGRQEGSSGSPSFQLQKCPKLTQATGLTLGCSCTLLPTGL